jgi:NAD(P)-dependent dehydrogenase (short-subunit alcohol dehydrogenase family)
MTSTCESMQSLPMDYRALVIGASGAIGQAFCAQLEHDPRCARVIELSRDSQPAFDLREPQSIAEAALALQAEEPLQLIINAAGMLHSQHSTPEKKLAELDYPQLLESFQINTFGPALLLRHFSPLLDRQRGVMLFLSARVGSIGDNRLGGWYSYRSAKAALNMLIKTAAIELGRTQPNSLLLAMHPGTVQSPLSAPFSGARQARPAAVAVAQMLRVADSLGPGASGQFYAYDGVRLPW